ncbi:beta-parvin [Grus japonensis]|uniref:Beta-parvin n=1 Tax=Grus japonensis TaxID=30415 RepID=A0ABC9VV01_GRUJA
MPAGSKTGPPLAKAKPISASVITYLRRRKTLRERELLQPERGKREGLLQTTHVTEELTTTTEMMMGRFERDAFDTLFDHAPDKLSVVKKSLITFVNKHLNKLNLEVTELETQFADGVYLVLLMGLLEDYFVPLHNFYLTPESFDQKVHNVSFAFELMQDGGLKKPKARPEDVVNLDLKSTLRVLYNLFTKYKNVE